MKAFAMAGGGAESGAAAYCDSYNVTYGSRIDNEDGYDWCTVPNSGQDVILFAALAVVVACLCVGRLNSLMVLIAGGCLAAVMFPVNLHRLGNAIAIWLGIHPWELFFYIFLPPILLDAAVRTDWFMFKKLYVQIITVAFLVVGASTALVIPVMLYVFQLKNIGWTWPYAAIFGAMVGPTDAVSIVAILKSGGAPKRLQFLMEGESLLNDASSLTLFIIFLEYVQELSESSTAHHEVSGLAIFGNIVKRTVWLGVGGALIGLAFGIAVRYVLRFLRRYGAGEDAQIALTLACAYLAFYTANSPAKVSGVVAVAAYGLYGASTSKWDMSVKIEQSGGFDYFWETIAFIANGIVFFYSGVSSVNFFVRSSEQLYENNKISTMLGSLWRLPLIWIALFVIRFICIVGFRPLFRLTKQPLSMREAIFATLAGLRGSVSLIMAQAFVTESHPDKSDIRAIRVRSELVLWCSGYVLLTLLVNAPLLPHLLRWLGLADLPPAKRKMRRRVLETLAGRAREALGLLREDENELLRGADWHAVEQYIDISKELDGFAEPAVPSKGGNRLARTAARLSKLVPCMAPKPVPPPSVVDSKRPTHLHRITANLKAAAKLEGNSWARESVRMFGAPAQYGRGEGGVLQDLEMGAVNGDVAVPGPEVVMKELVRVSFGELEHANGGKGDDDDDYDSDDDPDAVHRELPFLRMEDVRHEPLSLSSSEHAGHAHEQRSETRVPRSSSTGTLKAARSEGEMAGGGGTPHDSAAQYLQRRSEQPAGALHRGSPSVERRHRSHTQPHFDGWSQTQLLPVLYHHDGRRVPILGFGGGPSIGPGTGSGGSEGSTGAGSLGLARPSIRRAAAAAPMLSGATTGEEPAAFGYNSVAASLEKLVRQSSPAIPGVVTGTSLAALALRRASGKLGLSSSDLPTPTAAAAGATAETPSSAADPRTPQPPVTPIGNMPELSKEEAEELADARVRLVAGLKRHFHEKRIAGLLSNEGMRILDNACDAYIDGPLRKLSLWGGIQKDVVGRYTVQGLARALFALRRVGLALRRRPRWLRAPLNAGLQLISTGAKTLLGRKMLLACEVAMEYLLALTHSDWGLWLRDGDVREALVAEVQLECSAVWHFIIDREIEAPERFQAIQSFRAAKAMLAAVQEIVEDLFRAGMIDDVERHILLKPIEDRERRLLHLGPVWRAPAFLEVLSNVPFLRSAPPGVVESLLKHGQLAMFRSGQVIHDGGADHGIFVVVTGLVRIIHTPPGRGAAPRDLFLGTGGVFGLFSALSHARLPGHHKAVAQGNALGKGPVVFRLQQSGIDHVRAMAARGHEGYQQVEVDMVRMAALYLVERLRPQLLESTTKLVHRLVAPPPPPARASAGPGVLTTLDMPDQLSSMPEQHPLDNPPAAATATPAPSGEPAAPPAEPPGTAAAPPQQQKQLRPTRSLAFDDLEESISALTGVPQRPRGGASRLPSTDESGGEGDDGAAGANGVRLSRDEQDKQLWKECGEQAVEVLEELTLGLRAARLVHPAPGAHFRQDASLVLLSGSLVADVRPAGSGGAERQAEYVGPCVLPWVWDVLAPDDIDLCIPFTVGPTGALMAACPGPGLWEAAHISDLREVHAPNVHAPSPMLSGSDLAGSSSDSSRPSGSSSPSRGPGSLADSARPSPVPGGRAGASRMQRMTPAIRSAASRAFRSLQISSSTDIHELAPPAVSQAHMQRTGGAGGGGFGRGPGAEQHGGGGRGGLARQGSTRNLRRQGSMYTELYSRGHMAGPQ